MIYLRPLKVWTTFQSQIRTQKSKMKEPSHVPNRPSPVLDVTRQREVCAMLACGCSLRAAASYVGCAPSTISRTAKHDLVFANFIRRAYMRRELKLLEKIRNAGETQWRASAWLLERLYPHRYGPERLRGRPSSDASSSSSSSSSSTDGDDFLAANA